MMTELLFWGEVFISSKTESISFFFFLSDSYNFFFNLNDEMY